MIVGNYIGLGLDGTTIAGNGGNGLELNGFSGNTIGGIGAAATSSPAIASTASISAVRRTTRSWATTSARTRPAPRPRQRRQRHPGDAGAFEQQCHRRASGNVISGNDANGVLINGSATLTTVSGNLIGLAAWRQRGARQRLDGVRGRRTPTTT